MKALAVLLLVSVANAQIYDLLLKNGRVIDPANHRDGKLDIAIVSNKIARVAANLPAAHARVVLNVGDYAVTPGLIDLKAHVQLDHNCLPNGVTTVVDAGEHAKHTKTHVLGAKQLPAAQPLYEALFGSSFKFGDPHMQPIISTGLDSESVLLIRAGMMTTLSKLLNLGVPLEQLVERVTANPARAIGRSDLGTLSEGSIADIAVIATERGHFSFLDANLQRLTGRSRLRCVLTILNGAVVWDIEGLSAPDWIQAGPYSNYK